MLLLSKKVECKVHLLFDAYGRNLDLDAFHPDCPPEYQTLLTNTRRDILINALRTTFYNNHSTELPRAPPPKLTVGDYEDHYKQLPLLVQGTATPASVASFFVDFGRKVDPRSRAAAKLCSHTISLPALCALYEMMNTRLEHYNAALRDDGVDSRQVSLNDMMVDEEYRDEWFTVPEYLLLFQVLTVLVMVSPHYDCESTTSVGKWVYFCVPFLTSNGGSPGSGNHFSRITRVADTVFYTYMKYLKNCNLLRQPAASAYVHSSLTGCDEEGFHFTQEMSSNPLDSNGSADLLGIRNLDLDSYIPLTTSLGELNPVDAMEVDTPAEPLTWTPMCDEEAILKQLRDQFFEVIDLYPSIGLCVDSLLTCSGQRDLQSDDEVDEVDEFAFFSELTLGDLLYGRDRTSLFIQADGGFAMEEPADVAVKVPVATKVPNIAKPTAAPEAFDNTQKGRKKAALARSSTLLTKSLRRGTVNKKKAPMAALVKEVKETCGVTALPFGDIFNQWIGHNLSFHELDVMAEKLNTFLVAVMYQLLLDERGYIPAPLVHRVLSEFRLCTLLDFKPASRRRRACGKKKKADPSLVVATSFADSLSTTDIGWFDQRSTLLTSHQFYTLSTTWDSATDPSFYTYPLKPETPRRYIVERKDNSAMYNTDTLYIHPIPPPPSFSVEIIDETTMEAATDKLPEWMVHFYLVDVVNKLQSQ
jgi:hypothetical protein